MEEYWQDIEEFPGYEVSSLGRIRSHYRKRIVRQSHTNQGALKVNLRVNGSTVTRSVKVLVALAFVPGRTEQFNTPLQMDGNQDNVAADNLVWRPRWFCWKYSRQLESIDRFYGVGPIIDRKTGIQYEDIASAAMSNGLLPFEVQMALVNKVPVFPTWHIFDWWHE